MGEAINSFVNISIPMVLTCDGSRRKENNMIKRSKCFDWGSGAVNCAYWEGPPLRDVRLAAGIPDQYPSVVDD